MIIIDPIMFQNSEYEEKAYDLHGEVWLDVYEGLFSEPCIRMNKQLKTTLQLGDTVDIFLNKEESTLLLGKDLSGEGAGVETFKFDEAYNRTIFCGDYIKRLYGELDFSNCPIGLSFWDLEVVETEHSGLAAQVFMPTELEVDDDGLYSDD